MVDDAHDMPKHQKLYVRRKEIIKRGFANGKGKYAMRYTQYRSLAKACFLLNSFFPQ